MIRCLTSRRYCTFVKSVYRRDRFCCIARRCRTCSTCGHLLILSYSYTRCMFTSCMFTHYRACQRCQYAYYSKDATILLAIYCLCHGNRSKIIIFHFYRFLCFYYYFFIGGSNRSSLYHFSRQTKNDVKIQITGYFFFRN